MCFIGEYFVIGIGKFVVLLVRIFEREIVILNCDLLCFLLLLSGRRAVVSYTWHLATRYLCKRSNKSKNSQFRMATKPTELDEAQQALETKLKHIAITREKTERILSSNNEQRIERHRDALKDLVNAADSSKRTVEGLKIANGEDIESIRRVGRNDRKYHRPG